MIQRKPDAMITIPVDNTATAPAYKKVSQAGIKVVYMLQNPRGLKPGTDYVTIVSQDMEGSAYGAAAGLAKYIPKNGTMGILTFGVDFFTTNVRTKGVNDWLKKNRPDIKVKTAKFINPPDAGRIAGDFLTANPDVQGLYSDWVDPGMQALSAMRATGKILPGATFDLGDEGALEMAKGGGIKYLAGQQPYDQGVVEATAAIKALLGKQVPPWVVLPALPVIKNNLLASYKKVWHKDPPANLVAACQKSGGCDAPAG
jgi:ribose transport system substrate-binding protein